MLNMLNMMNMCFPKVGDQESNVDRVNAPSELVDHPIL